MNKLIKPLRTRIRYIFFGPTYQVANHSALTSRGNQRQIRLLLVVAGGIWLALVTTDGIARYWERRPKSLRTIKGANVLNQRPNLRQQPWPLEGNLARKLAVAQLEQPYAAAEDTTARYLTTDAYGYRLGNSLPPYQVVLCGDSFFDNNIIADSLARYSKLSVGNMAIDGRGPLSMVRFLAAAPPAYREAKIVVWTKIESAVKRTEFESMAGQFKELLPQSRLKSMKHSWEQSILWPASLDLYLTESSALKHYLTRISSEVEWTLTGQYTSEIVLGRQNLPVGQVPMLFQAIDAGLLPAPSTEDLLFIADRIAEVNQQLRQRGITLFFALAPDKSTIYQERLPQSHPFRAHFEAQLENLLHARGVKTIGLSQGIRKAALERPTVSLYYTTDTHWNELGQSLAAHIIADSIKHSQMK
ncbi:alginate O-acetyltransferase AlgX-related protein [Hymenobacter terricola]|uniref:alginate O-acetyltransferase AlgX-related protein n=1 Tax=Hymenobacter terricola TaxID=2819236 RepID=UPI001B306FD2|nr:hypothetical protein [Hymenobacter terricola]